MSTALLEPQLPAASPDVRYTPEDLLRMPDGSRFELINGQLVERNMGAEASVVAAKAIRLVGNHAGSHRLGKVFATDCGYQIFADEPGKVRFPDGSFIARGRLPDDKVPKGHVRIAPDLSLDVVPPNDVAEDVETKRIAFMKAGTKLLWVIYPETRTVHVFRLEGVVSVLGPEDVLTGEDVRPGFSCRVADLFEDA
jgi:Uma2 family endonuclease